MVNQAFEGTTQIPTLEEKCLRICKTIVESGIAIRGGKIAAGGNNVLARNMANRLLNDNDAMGRLNGYATGPFAEFKNLIVAYKDGRLEDAAKAAVAIKGFSNEGRINIFDAKPLNWDVNAAGARNNTYAEPSGVAKDYVGAFGVAYKNPALTERKVGDGSAFTPR